MRLIDADAFIDHIDSSKMRCWLDGGRDADDIIDLIWDAPTIDPESLVKRGRWVYEAHKEKTNCRWHVTAKCSECSEYANDKREVWAGFFPNVPDLLARAVALQDAEQVPIGRYCSNCGAKMVEEDT